MSIEEIIANTKRIINDADNETNNMTELQDQEFKSEGRGGGRESVLSIIN
jgi:hypothetical protein